MSISQNLKSPLHTQVTFQQILDSEVKLTPMMNQYASIKQQYPEALLFFRMGDFYELFFEDAVCAAKLLNITLTHRGKLGDIPIPMAGIPHHSAHSYVDRITSQGYKVAICEQVEDPKEAKGIVQRKITQVVGPGIPFDLEKTDVTHFKYLASAAFTKNEFYLVLLDFINGEFLGLKCVDEKELIEKLELFAPKEFISSLGQWDQFPQVKDYLSSRQPDLLITYLSEEYFSPQHASLYIEKLIPGFHRDEVIRLTPGVLKPIGALSYYICSTQILNKFVHIRPFRMEAQKDKMKVTLPTLRGLEILPKGKESYRDSLLGHFDKTKTSVGTRELRYLFQSPSSSVEEIKERHHIIKFFLENPDLLKSIREDLSDIRDLERIFAKISTKKVTSQDLLHLSSSIATFIKILHTLKNYPHSSWQKFSKKDLTFLQEVSLKIKNILNEELGASLEKGNLIKKGFSKERDRLFQISTHSAEEILDLENKYRKTTKINNLKIKYNNISGYFIEISKSHLSKVPKSFERRQTLVNSERFVSKELIEFEKDIITAKEKLEKLEKKIFDDLVDEISLHAPLVMKLSRMIAAVDINQSFAWVALQEDLTCPDIFPSEKILQVKGAWHPLIKSNLKNEFVVHDLTLNKESYFALITGPNMAGKTTVMREMAIIQFLAQIGSFVPAQQAKLGLCDYLFSRLGASDDILKGQSTFMVEMSETAEIIRHASEKSLIIMDEVGRGTSTYDGLSIAWSLVEHFITETKALTLFSTHYHELIDVVKGFPHAKNLTVETKVNQGEVQFLYRLIEAATTRSYGIFVAKLAGLPTPILKRAETLLQQLEVKPESSVENSKKNLPDNYHPHREMKENKQLKENKETKADKEKNNKPAKNNKKPKKFKEVQLCFFPNEELIVQPDVYETEFLPLVEEHFNHHESMNEETTTETHTEDIIPDFVKDILSDLSQIDVMNMTPLQALEKLHHLHKNVRPQ